MAFILIGGETTRELNNKFSQETNRVVQYAFFSAALP